VASLKLILNSYQVAKNQQNIANPKNNIYIKKKRLLEKSANFKKLPEIKSNKRIFLKKIPISILKLFLI